MVVLLRLAPVVPFAALNYALGATGIPLWTYTWASALGIIPGVRSCCAAATAFQPPAGPPRSAHATRRANTAWSCVPRVQQSGAWVP